jgi:hypothetical protein
MDNIENRIQKQEIIATMSTSINLPHYNSIDPEFHRPLFARGLTINSSSSTFDLNNSKLNLNSHIAGEVSSEYNANSFNDDNNNNNNSKNNTSSSINNIFLHTSPMYQSKNLSYDFFFNNNNNNMSSS